MIKKLKLAGLSDKEIKIYLDVIKAGPIKANEIAKRLGIERTVTYNTLTKLVDKGLITYFIKKGTKLFNATDPENLLRPLQEKEKILQEIIPQIRSIQKIKPMPLKIELYEGKEGIKTVFLRLLKNKKKEFILIGGRGKIYDILKYEIPQFEREAIKQKVQVRALLNYPKQMHHRIAKESFVKAKILPKGYEIFNAIAASEDLVAIHFFRQEKPKILLIENKKFAESCHNIFELLWKITMPF